MAKAATTEKTPPASPLPSVKMLVPTEAGNLKDAVAASGATKGTVYLVPFEQIQVAPGFNVRVKTPDYFEELDELVESILSEGFYDDKPLTGYIGLTKEGQSAFFVMDGHRRYEAAKKAIAAGAEIARLPVIVTSKKEPQDILVALDKTATGAKLTMLDRAFIVKRFIGAGFSDEQIVEKLKISMQHLRDINKLLNAPKEIKLAVQAGKIAPQVAIDVIKKCNKGDADPKGEKAVEAVKDMLLRAQARGAKGGKASQTLDSKEGTAGGKKVEVVQDEDTGEVKAEIVKVKPRTITTKWGGTEGEVLSAKDTNFLFFKSLGGDKDWFRIENDKCVLTETVHFVLQVTRPPKAEPAAEPATAKRGKAAAEPIMVPTKKKPRVTPVVAVAEETAIDTLDSVPVDPDLNTTAPEL